MGGQNSRSPVFDVLHYNEREWDIKSVCHRRWFELLRFCMVADVHFYLWRTNTIFLGWLKWTCSKCIQTNHCFLVVVLQISHQEPAGEVKASKVGGNENVCSMCIEFAGEAIEYFENNKTQTEIISNLHKGCSRLTLFEQQVVSHGYWQLEFG